MKEKEILEQLKKDLQSIIDFESIEEATLPDIYYSGEKYNGWIELKQNNKLKINYRPGQQNWLKKERKKKLNTFVLFCYKGMFYLLIDFDIITFTNIKELESTALWYGKHFRSLYFLEKLKGRT